MKSSINGLPKGEHLGGEKRIATLFKEGAAFVVYPFRVVYLCVPREEVSVKVLFSVPKRQFKHAVDRNRFKRLMREGYRLQKTSFGDIDRLEHETLLVAITAVSKDIPSQEKVMQKLEKVIEKLKNEMTCEKC